MSKVFCVGPSWRGFHAIGRLIIFGDSYSSVSFYVHDTSKSTPAEPLGCKYPGDGVWNEENHPNWVGHLITKYRPGPKYTPQEKANEQGQAIFEEAKREKQSNWVRHLISKYRPGQKHVSPEKADEQDQTMFDDEVLTGKEAWTKNPLLVHDYAKGGDTVHGVKRQVGSFLAASGSGYQTTWTAEESLYVVWVGINDCAMGYLGLDESMEVLMKQLDELYQSGARNFLLVDVPPVQRSPAVPVDRADRIAATVDKWNSNLTTALQAFIERHTDSSTFLYSSLAFFNALLNDPTSSGFPVQDLTQKGGSIWVDHIHPTTRVHDHLAKDITRFLTEIPKVVVT